MMKDFKENKKAKTHKGKLHLESLLPKVNEDPKNCLFLNTNNSSEIMRMVMNDLYLMRKDYSKKLGNKNKLRCVFEDRQNVEFLCGRNNSSLFTYSSDTKKREMNLVLGSLFSNEILDLFEFEVTNYIPISHFAQSVWIDSCMKPVILFQGDVFETEFNYERLKKFFLDYFRLHDVEDVDVSDLKRILVISAGDNKVVKIRSYQIDGDINEYNLNKIKFTEVGPSLNLKTRRIVLADEEKYKTALKQPKEKFVKPKKNIENNSLGEKRGRIHMEKQNLNTVALRKYKKILGRKRFNKKEEAKTDTKTSEGISLNDDKNI